MIGAEWKKLLRQRWLIGIAILLIFVDVGLFLNTQYTDLKMPVWISIEALYCFLQ